MSSRHNSNVGVLITGFESGCTLLQQLEVPYCHFHDVFKIQQVLIRAIKSVVNEFST
jgi:hypothetical protein